MNNFFAKQLTVATCAKFFLLERVHWEMKKTSYDRITSKMNPRSIERNDSTIDIDNKVYLSVDSTHIKITMSANELTNYWRL